MDINKYNIGDKASFSKTVTETDIYLFSGITGDFNPVHLDAEYAKTTIFRERIAQGLLTASFMATILGTKLPGPGTIYLSQNLTFMVPVRIGDTITAEVEIIEKIETKKQLILQTTCSNQKGELVINGQARVLISD